MYFDTKTMAGTVEILASPDFTGVPIKIDEEGPVKSGMPITQDGKKSPDGTNSVGILLYDVDPARNPNATIVVGDAVIDWAKVKAHNNDVTADAQTIATALPRITFREVGGEDGDGKTYNSVQ